LEHGSSGQLSGYGRVFELLKYNTRQKTANSRVEEESGIRKPKADMLVDVGCHAFKTSA
jgi:hypothetical protein